MPPFSGASEKHSETGEIKFQPISFDVVPIIAPPPTDFNDGVSVTTHDVDDTGSDVQPAPDFNPDPNGFDFRDAGGMGQVDDDPVTLEECQSVTKMVASLPSMFGHSYLVPESGECDPFAKELYKYCQKKQLDPRDWFFDEFGLVVTGFGIVGGMYSKFKDHKAETKKPAKMDVGDGVDDSYSRAVPEPKPIPEERPDDAEENNDIGMVMRR